MKQYVRYITAMVLTALTCNAWTHAARLPKQKATPFWEDLKLGPYMVGFRVLYHRDRSRKWLKQRGTTVADPGRPIRISLWYPANPRPSNHQMTYGDYLHHLGSNGFRRFNQQLDKMDIESWLSDLRELTPPGQPMFGKLQSTPTAAYQNASAAPGLFPLVLYSGGKGSRADDNVELAEFLASYGYVVATVPQLGPSDQELELGSSPQEISLHADDFDVALVILRQLNWIDFEHIATAGHSAGGEAAVELALRHSNVRAVVGLDGSYGMAAGARIFRQLPEYVPGRDLHAALLDIRRAEGSQGVKLDLDAIDALHWNDVYRVRFEKAYHGDFTEWGMLAWKLAIPMPANPYGHTRQIGYKVNRVACHAVLNFLEGELRGRSDVLMDLERAIQVEPAVAFTHFSAARQPDLKNKQPDK